MAELPGLKVIRSSIHGYGLVATRDYKAGDTVCHGDGVLYREKETFDDTYCLVMPGYETDENGNEGPPLYWDLVDQTRWINHSCEPNTYVDSSWDAATRDLVEQAVDGDALITEPLAAWIVDRYLGVAPGRDPVVDAVGIQVPDEMEAVEGADRVWVARATPPCRWFRQLDLGSLLPGDLTETHRIVARCVEIRLFERP